MRGIENSAMSQPSRFPTVETVGCFQPSRLRGTVVFGCWVILRAFRRQGLKAAILLHFIGTAEAGALIQI